MKLNKLAVASELLLCDQSENSIGDEAEQGLEEAHHLSEEERFVDAHLVDLLHKLAEQTHQPHND